jgi:hypothetical protein
MKKTTPITVEAAIGCLKTAANKVSVGAQSVGPLTRQLRTRPALPPSLKEAVRGCDRQSGDPPRSIGEIVIERSVAMKTDSRAVMV